ncbi:MAG: septum formation protein Maf [Lachnospiraceae bacterium]|nr:septum formation protein Maf [Lachnospiraceae bacterium]
MKEFVLASASPRRKELLTQIGIQFRACVSKKEEEILRNYPEDIVKDISYTKARDVFERGNRDTIVIGADTIVVFEEKVLGKPKDEEEAYRMIKMLQGNTHQVYTGVSIIWQQNNDTHVSSFVAMTEVELYYMNEGEIRSYIATKEPYDKAGGYAIQGYFARYVKQIKGDYNNVVGLPIGKLYQVLNSLNLLS